MPVTMKQIETHLNDRGLKYYVSPDRQNLIVPFPTGGDLLNVTIMVSEDGEYLRCQIPCFLNATHAVDRQALFIEMLNLNYKLKLAKLGFDPTDDEINVEAALPIEDGSVTDKQLCRLFGSIFHMMNSCRPALMELIRTGMSASQREDEVVRKLLEDIEVPDDIGEISATDLSDEESDDQEKAVDEHSEESSDAANGREG